MELLVAGLLTGAVVLGSTYSDNGPNAYDVQMQQELVGKTEQTVRDIIDAGDVYYMQGRPLSAANAALQYVSEWYLPMSNPMQIPTYDYTEVVKQRAVNNALLESQAPRYMFQSKDTLGIAYGAGEKNNGYNIGCPYPGVSFEGDPGFSLAQGAKVFIDRYEVPEISEYTNRWRTYAGEPTETLRAELPNEADVLISSRNPYGPLGYYMQLLRNNLFEKEAVREDFGIPPGILHNNHYKKPWGVRFTDYQPGVLYN